VTNVNGYNKENEMGGVVNAFNDLIGGGSSQSVPQAPATPNYTQAAQATATGNMIGQNNPYGSLNYQQTGTDQFGNPTYTANQSIAPNLQNAVNNSQNAISNYSFGSFNPTNLPSVGINPGQTYQQAEMSILQPQLDRQRSQTQTQLANQGIQPGSEAYNNAMYDLENNQNNLLANVTTQGIGVGLNANNQAFNQQQNAYNTNLAAPFTYANNVKSLATPSYVQTPAGPNYLGAVNQQYTNQLGAYNAGQANQTNQSNGLLGLGGVLGGSYLMSPSTAVGTSVANSSSLIPTAMSLL